MPRYYRRRTSKPRARRYRRRTYKRTYRRRRGPPISSLFGGFPMSKVVKLKYAEQVALPATTFPIAGTYSFRANSLYDPNQTGVGHQPMGFDMWAAVYNHYTVIGSKIRVSYMANGTSAVTNVLGVILHEDGTLGVTDVQSLIEQGKSKYKLVDDKIGDSGQVHRLTQTFSAKKFFGIRNVRDNISDIGSRVDQNPTDGASFVIWAGSTVSNTTAVSVLVEIEYIALFTEPKEMTGS